MTGKIKVSFWQNLKSDLAWLFSFNDIDDHYVIKIFGIKFCKKHGVNVGAGVNINEINEIGVTLEKRTPQVIVSLTTFPARINSVYKTISTLLQQTVKPDRLVLWLAEPQFPEKNLPDNLTRLQEFGLEIRWIEKDIRSFKKLIPALKEFPNDIVITVDDDNYYDSRLVEFLYNSYLENPDCIHARQAFVVKHDKNGKLVMKSRNYFYNSTYLPSYMNEPVGCGGVLYPPHSLDENVLNEEQFMKIVPTNDDLWFWAHALIKGTKINVIKNNYKLKNYIVENSQQDALWQKNMINSTSVIGMSGFDTINMLREMFSQVKEKTK